MTEDDSKLRDQERREIEEAGKRRLARMREEGVSSLRDLRSRLLGSDKAVEVRSAESTVTAEEAEQACQAAFMLGAASGTLLTARAIRDGVAAGLDLEEGLDQFERSAYEMEAEIGDDGWPTLGEMDGSDG